MPGFNIGGSGGDPNGKVETRRSYRWRFTTIEDPNADQGLVYLKSASRPRISFEGPIEQHHQQERIYHIGKTQWDTITMAWYDVEQDPDVSAIIYQWLENSTYNISEANPEHPSVYKKNAKLEMLNHLGSATESWTLLHSWPLNVNWNGLDYETNNLMLIETELRYDRAIKN